MNINYPNTNKPPHVQTREVTAGRVEYSASGVRLWVMDAPTQQDVNPSPASCGLGPVGLMQLYLTMIGMGCVRKRHSHGCRDYRIACG